MARGALLAGLAIAAGVVPTAQGSKPNCEAASIKSRCAPPLLIPPTKTSRHLQIWQNCRALDPLGLWHVRPGGVSYHESFQALQGA